MAIISIGTINKKLLYPLLFSTIYALLYIYWHYNESNIATYTIDNIGASIGKLLTFFVNIKFKYKFKKKKAFKHTYFKDFFIQFLISVLILTSTLFGVNFEKEGEGTNYVNKFYINDALLIIFITIITYFILKVKYYIHHIISIFAIVILNTIIDIILKNFFNIRFFVLISSIVHVLSNSLLLTYYKYLIDFKYYYFLDVLLAEGIIHFFLDLVTFCTILLIQNLNDSKTIFSDCLDYNEEYGIINILLRFFASLIFEGFINSLLSFLIIKELSPNFVIITYGLSRIPSSLIEYEGLFRWIILIISIFQVIFLLFYLEIIEYNFCFLNKNTKKNILKREQKLKEDNINDYDCEDNNIDEITINGYDITEGLKNGDGNFDIFSEEKTEDSFNY